MGFDFTLIISVKSGQLNPSSPLGIYHPWSGILCQLPGRRLLRGIHHHNLQEERMKMENDQQALSIKDSDINQIGVS